MACWTRAATCRGVWRPRGRRIILQRAQRLKSLVVQLAGPAPALLLRAPGRVSSRSSATDCAVCDGGPRAGGERGEEVLILCMNAGPSPIRRARRERPTRVRETRAGDHRGRAAARRPPRPRSSRARRSSTRSGAPTPARPPATVPVGSPVPSTAVPADRQRHHPRRHPARGERAASGLDDRPTALHDQLEHPVEVGLAAHRTRDRRGHLEASDRALELLAPTLCALVQPRVVDGDRRPFGQHDGALDPPR